MYQPRSGQLSSRRSLRLPLLFAGALTLTGSVGYKFIENWPWGESFYMVFITLSTVGFAEVEPLSPLGRLWTVLLIVAGVGTIGYLVAGVFELLMEGSIYGFRRQKRMENLIAQLQGHTIICGYGRVGRQVVKDFLAAEKDIVVVDAVDPERKLEEQGILHVVGKAESESTLQAAGIERAEGIVAAVDSDTENVFITLTARQLKPDIRVIARASDSDTARKLKLVGAERVVSPYVASGKRMAHLALRPHAVDFFDVLSDPLRELQVEMHEIEIAAGGRLAGQTLRDLDLRRTTGIIAVALRTGTHTSLNPDPDARMEVGSRLVAMGTTEQCARLEELNEPQAAES